MTGNDNLPQILPPKDDIVFKMLFGDERNEKTLIAFLEAVLKTEIIKIIFVNPFNKQLSEEDKLSILDVKAELPNGERINIEMQSRNLKEMRNRITFYNDSMTVEQLGNSEKYSKIKPAISIIIVKKTLINESSKCHNVFSMLEETEHFQFNDLKRIHILDLSRIEREENQTLSEWLEFIDSEKEDDFMRVARKNKAIEIAFDELKVLSLDKERRAAYQSRLKFLRDNAAEKDDAVQDAEKRGRRKGRMEGKIEGRIEGMQLLIEYLAKGYSLDEAKKKFSV